MEHLEANILKVFISFVVGAILGLEREYNDKPAGFRTVILITIGSTLFTIVSNSFFVNPERVASNIVTGIGFIGAGVMFRQGIDVKGITTASTIWLAAALGMAIAQELYALTACIVVIVLATLLLLNKLERKFLQLRQRKIYQFTLKEGVSNVQMVEEILNKKALKYDLSKVLKQENKIVLVYKIVAGLNDHKQLEKEIISHEQVETMEV